MIEGNDDLSSGMFFFIIPKRFFRFVQRVTFIDHGDNFPVFKEFFDKAVTESNLILDHLNSDTEIGKKSHREIRWRALNGRGVANMFHSDYQELIHREQGLRQALKDFEEANRQSHSNWEIVCNLGSVHMRLGYVYRHKPSPKFKQSQLEFERSRKFLEDVISRIRPNYGFALYELGRNCRLQQEYVSAVQWFNKAIAVPEKERNVKDKGLEKELERVRAGNDAFP